MKSNCCTKFVCLIASKNSDKDIFYKYFAQPRIETVCQVRALLTADRRYRPEFFVSR